MVIGYAHSDVGGGEDAATEFGQSLTHLRGENDGAQVVHELTHGPIYDGSEFGRETVILHEGSRSDRVTGAGGQWLDKLEPLLGCFVDPLTA
ncbi:unannotated protein [freshwater metagenome]|uniref:Unannotated protein n=1 Tax=freshwater metagenome TaxID=449393 RepID=A0A6J6W4C4_9ZZZZ